MSLSADRELEIADNNGTTLRWPGLNANVFYRGAYVQFDDTNGVVKEAADTSGFVGFGVVTRHVTADGANGDNEVCVAVGPMTLKRVAVTGVSALTNNGDLVYATADDTLTTSATANTKAIGEISRYYGSSTKADVLVYGVGVSRGL